VLEAVLCVVEHGEDVCLDGQQVLWVLHGDGADDAEGVGDAEGDGGDGRAVEDGVLGEALCVGQLVLVQLEERRSEQALDGGPLLGVDVDAGRDDVQDESKFVLARENLGRGESFENAAPDLVHVGLLSWEGRHLFVVGLQGFEGEFLGIFLTEEGGVGEVLDALHAVLEVDLLL